ncbi:MAG TPA: glycosyltransferase family 39 protein [Chloroflexia bacterium]|nr:glycosyltransferase family 39 protein [Chloroflexia bacterium]
MDSITNVRPGYGLEESGVLSRVKERLAATLNWAMTGERPIILALCLVGFLAHTINMLDYPSFTFKDDEGIYAGQAWAVLRLGRLTPYTYFYDHAPAGWLLAAAWTFLTGGPRAFGGAIDSGRAFMLVLHMAMLPMLYGITRRLGGNILAAGIATGFFALSPLAIFYQRMFLLDNIMMFWLLLSLFFLLDEKNRLSHLVISGLAFGMALVSKETAIFVLPALLLLAWRQRRKEQKETIFGMSGWVVPMIMVISWYPLYALLKGELLGAGQAFGFNMLSGSSGQGVSLVDALKWQSSRGGGGLFNLDNLFWQLVRNDWFQRDPLLLAGGALATGLNLLRSWRKPYLQVAGLLGLLPLVYLGRGGIVFDYYILFAIPFLALNLGLFLGPLLGKFSGRGSLYAAGGLALCALVIYTSSGALPALYTEHPDNAGRQALNWIKQNVPAQSRIITRDDMWTDLHEASPEGPAFPNAHSHWKVASDPAIRWGVFKDDWHNVDYLIMSPGLIDSFKSTNNKVALDALAHAHMVKRWVSAPGHQNLHPQQIVELWQVDKTP